MWSATRSLSGHVPSYGEPGATNAVRILIKATQAVDFKGGKIDVTKLAQALENAELPTDIGTIIFRKEDHQALLPVVVSKVTKDAKYPADDTDMDLAGKGRPGTGRDLPGPVLLQDAASVAHSSGVRTS